MMRWRSQSLFLRIFLSFWLTIGLMLLAVMLFSTLAGKLHQHALDGVAPATLVQQARTLARTQGTPALRSWVEHTEADHAALKIYIVDDDLQEILGRTLPPRVRDWIGTHLEEDAALLNAGSEPRGPANMHSWWNVHALHTPGDTHLHMAFLPFASPYTETLDNFDLPLLLLVFALSLPVCWWLGRHISHPVRQLQHGAQAFGEGDFNIALEPALLQRGDEFGALARTFDGMAGNVVELLESKENLLRDVSHELRSPLARLRLALELARRDASAPSMAVRFERIEQECTQLDRMVGQLLYLARLRGAQTDMPEVLDLAGLINQVVDDARFEARSSKRQIAWQAPIGALQVLGVPLQLRSVLENVVRNALRHAPGTSPVSVRAWCDDKSVMVEIGDHGPGVPEAELAQLLQPFYRASGTAEHEGAGLGLTIASTLLARHGGGISLRNRSANDAPGHDGGYSGLIVSIRLPAL